MTGDHTLPINSDLFILGEIIGSGSFSQVYRAVDKTTRETIAIKSYRMRKTDVNQYYRAAAEMAFLRFLNHPNIIRYVLCDITKEYMCLGIELSVYGSLTSYRKKTIKFTEVECQYVMRQLISALCYLHGMNIYHGDIKPENIIVVNINSTFLDIKLTDFGLADVIINPEENLKRSGSFHYMAPEIHLGFPSDYTCDIFSAGVVMYELLFTNKPFNINVPRDVYVSNLRRRVKIQYPQFETQLLSPNCIELLGNMLSYDKKERLSGTALAKHPFLSIDLITDQQNHYMKACECLLKSVGFVGARDWSLGYMEVTEAILHLKVHLHHIRADESLCLYIRYKLAEYRKYADLIEDRLVSDGDENTEPISIATQSEKLRCLLQSTPALLNGYDICCVGEMYFIQHNVQLGSKKLKDGLDILFQSMPREPNGLRKHLLLTKIDQWLTMLENMKNAMEMIPNDH